MVAMLCCAVVGCCLLLILLVAYGHICKQYGCTQTSSCRNRRADAYVLNNELLKRGSCVMASYVAHSTCCFMSGDPCKIAALELWLQHIKLVSNQVVAVRCDVCNMSLYMHMYSLQLSYSR